MICAEKYILTDIDDSILMLSEAFQQWADRQGLQRIKCIHEAGTIEASLGMTFDEALPIVTEFVNSSHFGELEPEPCAADVLPELHRAGYRFVGITACDFSPALYARRWRNIQEAFGFKFDDIFLSGFQTGTGKGPYLKRYQPTVFVEDSFKNAVLGADLGHNSLLIDRAANTGNHDSRVRRVANWYEIEHLL